MPRLHLGGTDRRRSGPSSSRRGTSSSHRADGFVGASSSSSHQAEGPPQLSSSASSSLPPMPATGTDAPDDYFYDYYDDIFEFDREERHLPSDDDYVDDPRRKKSRSPAGRSGEVDNAANRNRQRPKAGAIVAAANRNRQRPKAGAIVAATVAARPPEIRKAAAPSYSSAENGQQGNGGDERWLENFNLLRPCIAKDGSVDYSALDDDDDDDDDEDGGGGGTTRRRIRNFVKEQRRRYTRLVGDNDEGDGGGLGRVMAADERLRLLAEAGFDFRPSETNKARMKEKGRASTAKVNAVGEGRTMKRGHKPGKNAPRRDDLDCLRDTDDDDISDEGDDGGRAAVGEKKRKKTVATRRKGEEIVSKRLKSEWNTKRGVATKSDDIATGGVDDGGPSSRRRADNHDDDERRRLHRMTTQVLPLRVLAFDNRVLPTPIDDSSARFLFLDYILHVVHGGLDRGLLSSISTAANGASDANVGDSTIVASLAYATKEASRRCDEVIGNTGAGEAPMRTSVVPRVSYLFERDGGKVIGQDERSSWLSDLLHPVSVEFSEHRIGTPDKHNAPKGFAAADGWGYFGDLVEAIERKLSRPRGTAFRRARPITLFTTDANLFADSASSSHVRGIERFWKRIRVAFDANAVSSITIVIVETSSIMHMMTTTVNKYHDSYESASPLGDNDRALNATSLPSRLHLMQCVNDIRRRIMELHQSPCLQSNHLTLTPIKLNLEFIEGNSVSFHSLLQAWMNESFDQTYAFLWSGVDVVGAGVRGRLCFDLPETFDGIMCSISLDLQYTVLPNCIHSPATVRLVEEMRLFSVLQSSSVEVLQTIPLSSVDSSLIFGVPMSAQASLEDDICRYNEMKILTRQLWTYLSKNDVALVLLVRSGSKDNANGTELSRSSCSDVGEQLFLLACEDVVQKQPQAMDNESNLNIESFQIIPDKSRKGKSPCGMLYRYASKRQLLRFRNEETKSEVDEEDVTEMSGFYFDYVERSLATLVRTGMNPLLIGGGRS